MYDSTKPYTKRIKELIKRTWSSPFLNVQDARYPIITQTHNFREIDHSDGIGTKGELYWLNRDFKSAVQDALAMNLNDLLLCGARAHKLQNHLILPQDDHLAIEDIIKHLSDFCVDRQIVMTGGETSIHNNIDGLEIAICASGIEQYPIRGLAKSKDLIIGIESSGIHSNGLTLAKQILGNTKMINYLCPTIIYSDTILPILKKYFNKINAMMHITGGAFTKLKDCIPKNSDILIRKDNPFNPHQVFKDIKNRGNISCKEMYSTFNCGIGFVLFVKEQDSKKIIQSIETSNKPLKVGVIGYVLKGVGKQRVIVQSKFKKSFDDDKEVFSL